MTPGAAMSSADPTSAEDAARPPGNLALELEVTEAMYVPGTLERMASVDAHFPQPPRQAARKSADTLQQARASPEAKPAYRSPSLPEHGRAEPDPALRRRCGVSRLPL